MLIIFSCDNKIGLLPKQIIAVSTNVCDSVRYSVEIKPIFDANCAFPGCHAGSVPAGGVDLTTYANAKAKVIDGRIKARAIDGQYPGPMPASGFLPQAQLDLIVCWINNGALP